MSALPQIDPGVLDGLPADVRAQVEHELAALQEVLVQNPLERFHPHSPAQREFLAAVTRIVAAFAGNRFGKTTALVVWALIQLLPREWVPAQLVEFKRWEAPCYGRVVCPDLVSTLEGVIKPAFRKWCPPGALKGGGFDKAYDKVFRILRFECGSWVQFMTYEQDVDKFGGAALHWVGYDEPPPKEIRDECRMRLVDYGGSERFAMTPLKANTGWVKRDIWKKRADPGITVVRGSIHDNPTLDQAAKDAVLGDLGDAWRRAREFGDFVDIGGLIYSDYERAVEAARWFDESAPSQQREHVRGLDVVVGIDPGLRNAAFTWHGFDSENAMLTFDERLLQDATVLDYAISVHTRNARWGLGTRDEREHALRALAAKQNGTHPLPEEEHEQLRRLLVEAPIGQRPTYVIDPSARNRTMVNAQSVEAALAEYGIYSVHGQNDVEAGCQQVRGRIAGGMLAVSGLCVGLRDEADDYAAEDRPDGEFKPIKEHDHRLDTQRYAAMHRQWHPAREQAQAAARLGWRPGQPEPEWTGHDDRPVQPLGDLS